jgi:selenocysteine lyase/cysteine desulfurase
VVSDQTRLLSIGLGAAADYALAVGLENIRQRVVTLAGALHEGLSAVRGVVPVFPAPRTGIVAFSATGREDAVAAALATQRIRVAVVTARYHPVLFEDRGLGRVVRISPHYYNTEEEIGACVDAVARALAA